MNKILVHKFAIREKSGRIHWQHKVCARFCQIRRHTAGKEVSDKFLEKVHNVSIWNEKSGVKIA